jgi:hypothetical protein
MNVGQRHISAGDLCAKIFLYCELDLLVVELMPQSVAQDSCRRKKNREIRVSAPDTFLGAEKQK